MILGFGHVTFSLCSSAYEKLTSELHAQQVHLVLPLPLRRMTAGGWSGQRLSLLGPARQIEVTSFGGEPGICSNCEELLGNLLLSVGQDELPDVEIGSQSLNFLTELVGRRGVRDHSVLNLRPLRSGKSLRIVRLEIASSVPPIVLDHHGLVSFALYSDGTEIDLLVAKKRGEIALVKVDKNRFRVLFTDLGGVWLELIEKLD